MRPKANKSPLTIGKLVSRLKQLPERAILRRSTWERVVSMTDQQTPRVRQGFAPGQVSALHGVTTLAVDDLHERAQAFRVAGKGLISTDDTSGLRRWWIPLTVWDNPSSIPDARNPRPRAAELDGVVITRDVVMTTGLDEVPGLIGWRTPDGDWGDTRNPRWVAVPESDPDAEYPAPTVEAGWELLTSLTATAVAFSDPAIYLPRW